MMKLCTGRSEFPIDERRSKGEKGVGKNWGGGEKCM